MMTGNLLKHNDNGEIQEVKLANGSPRGGMRGDGSNDYISFSNSSEFQLGTLDFTLRIYFYLDDYSHGNQCPFSQRYGNSSDVWFMRFYASQAIKFNIMLGGVQKLDLTKQNQVLKNGLHWIDVVVHKGGDGVLYFDGVEVLRQSGMTSDDLDTPNVGFYLMSLRYNYYFFKGSLFYFQKWNRALSAAELLELSNNGCPDLAGINIADKWGSMEGQTSATLTTGKRYIIETFVTGDDFTNVGAGSNASGVEFIATGTTPTTWSNSSTLMRIGCVVDYRPENAHPYTWWESSDKSLHGAVNGALANDRFSRIKAVKTGITGDTTLTDIVSFGYDARTLLIKNTTANSVTINLGTTAAGTDVINALAIGANATVYASLSKTFFSDVNNQTLYLSSTNWNSSSLDINYTEEMAI